ncbi:DUF6381 family protein [Streptomyces sp. H10-C2]|uniref:DUF6381 family protein n=1 Tax=unclassified Streptomyces TaxID=2593676 RepID=UPI0024BBB03C|nr:MULTISPECIES: DUF6381 family protein [unclassified Streptomyces]MDJ0347045.1 DUF6381 family protein [Streptomyces sp. PH10-H1]MDJ0375313.1 DUF6381 family protein [Streptomyces sp. H10-C2]
MNVAGESGNRAQQMQDKVRELSERAERSTDPQERKKLQDKARHLQEKSMGQGGGMGQDMPGHGGRERDNDFPE